MKLVIILLSFLITSCMVGPDFHHPTPPKTEHYTEKPFPEKTTETKFNKPSGKTQYFLFGETLLSEWWELFHSPELNQLIQQGLLANRNVAAARAALIQAKENLYAQIGSTLLPAITGNYTAERERFNIDQFGLATTSTSSSIFNVFNANVAISYTLDVFGGLRRQIEAVQANVDFQQFELEGVCLTLTTNIVTTAITIASLNAQIQATEALIKAEANQLSLFNKQYQLGGLSKAQIYLQETQLAQTRALLPPLKQNRLRNKHALAVLLGMLPSESQLTDIDFRKLKLPIGLPISLPALLVRQRPDIRAAEASLHAASAQIGVATANLYPQITFVGADGWQGNVASTLFQAQNKVWNINAALLQPIFNGGALLARRRAAIAFYQQSLALYQQTVLQGFQNVADTLRALQQDAAALKAQNEAEVASRHFLSLTRAQFRLGNANDADLFIAESNYQQAVIRRIQAEADRFTDTAALFQALGGPWRKGRYG